MDIRNHTWTLYLPLPRTCKGAEVAQSPRVDVEPELIIEDILQIETFQRRGI